MNPSPFSGLHLFAAAHVALAVTSALLSPYIPGDRNLSVVVWLIGGLAVFVFVAWRSVRAWHQRGVVHRYMAGALLALAVTGVSLLISFAVMVEVWLWQGYSI